MPWPLQWASWLFIFAIGQGLFLCWVLASTPAPPLRAANRWLAALVMVFVLIIGHAWLGVTGGFDRAPQMARTIAPLPLLIGPLVWLYLTHLTQGRSFTARRLWHFLPFALTLLAFVPVVFQFRIAGSTPAATPFLAATFDSPLGGVLRGFGLFKALHIGVYCVASYRLMRALRAAQPHEALFKSLQRLLRLLGIGLAAAAVVFLAESLNEAFAPASDVVAATVLTAFVAGLALVAMRMPVGYQPPLAPTAEPAVASEPRAGPSLLSPDEQTRFLAALHVCMVQEHAYRDGELTLDALAGRLALSGHELSQLINQRLAMNFQEYLNGFRVEAFKLALRDRVNQPGSPQVNLLELGLASGFNSKSTLNRAFKKHTGLTPSEFRKSLGH